MVRTEFNKMNQIRGYFFIDGTQIAGDVDASASAIRIMERMIIKERMERILLKKKNPFISFLLFSLLEFPIPFEKVFMQDNFHDCP